MTIEEIRELIALVGETGVAELEVQRGENRVRIRKSFGSDSQIVVPGHPAPAPAPPAPGVTPASPAPPPIKAETSSARAPESSLVYQKSPIVGTFYEASSPKAGPFVRIGERVEVGKILCIIESMKLMNEIEADVAGVIESRLVENGQPVEYGEALFGIRPL